MALLLLVLLCGATPATAQEPTPDEETDESPISLVVEAGFDNHYRNNEWFPVTITITNDGPDMQGVLEWHFPGQFSSAPRFHHPIDLPHGAHKRVTMYVFSSEFARAGEARLLENKRELARAPVRLSSMDTNNLVVGVLSSNPTMLNSLTAMTFDAAPDTIVLHLSPDTLPTRVEPLATLDVLVLHDLSLADMSDAQRTALELWVRLGGQLVVGGGVSAEQTTAGLDALLPVRVHDLERNVSLRPLQSLATEPNQQSGLFPEAATVSTFDLKAGARSIDPGNLLLTHDVGIGQVIFVAFDLIELRAWSGEVDLWEHMLRVETQFQPEGGFRAQGQNLLRNVLAISSMQLPPFWLLVAFVLAYILLVGPINFLVLRRLRREELAWGTVPALVVVFLVGTYGVGFASRGTHARVLDLTLVEGFEDYPQAHLTSYKGIFSPNRRSYTLGFAPDMLVSMEQRNTTQTTAVQFDDNATSVPNALIDVSSLRTFLAEGTRPLDIAVESNLTVQRGSVQGTLHNLSDKPLHDALLVRGSRVIELGTLAAGAHVDVDANMSNSMSFPDELVYNDQIDPVDSRINPQHSSNPQQDNDDIFDRNDMLSTLFQWDYYSYGNRYHSGVQTSGMYDTRGFYLLGWREASLIDVELGGQPANQEGLILYVIRLDVDA